jgi:3-dehydroquinate synthase
LRIKQPFVEKDEFDRGIRRVFNYGHSFGHAIESATHYAVPHGIAVTMGMDMANYIAVKRRLLPAKHFERMHPVLRNNYLDFAATPIGEDALFSALLKDKKNTSSALRLIFPVGADAQIEQVEVSPDEVFWAQCRMFLAELAG